MVKKLLVAFALAALVGGVWIGVRGRGHTGSTTTSTIGPTIQVQTYFYLGAALVPALIDVPKSATPASAAARALVAGPPAGYRTTVPAGTTLERLTVTQGTAHAAFSPGLERASRTTQAQIVYTLTQFPNVRRVLIDAGGSPVSLANGAGKTIRGGATRDDYVDLTSAAAISVTAPTRDSSVTSPLRVLGTASVFEGTFILEVRSHGKVVKIDPITASQGAPARGTFDESLDLAPGSYDLVFYEASAKDGTHLHTTTVSITVVS